MVRTTPLAGSEPNATTPAARSVSLVSTKDVATAEIRWAHKLVLNHFSFNSCAILKEMLISMFTDSKTAEQFTLGPDKARYVIFHGLASYYFDGFIKKIFPTKFSLSF